jgi:hypothetical protein
LTVTDNQHEVSATRSRYGRKARGEVICVRLKGNSLIISSMIDLLRERLVTLSHQRECWCLVHRCKQVSSHHTARLHIFLHSSQPRVLSCGGVSYSFVHFRTLRQHERRLRRAHVSTFIPSSLPSLLPVLVRLVFALSGLFLPHQVLSSVRCLACDA